MDNDHVVTEPVRVLLLEMPQLLRGILEHAIHSSRDCELIVQPASEEISRDPMEHPDIVILGLASADDSARVSSLLARWPRAQVLTVMPAGDEAVVYEMRPHKKTLGPMSPTEVVAALREAVHRNRWRERSKT